MKVIVTSIVSYAIVIMILSLVTELFFRLISKFSKESRNFFRWVYMICAAVAIIGAGWLGWKSMKFTFSSTPEGVIFCLMVAIAGMLSFYLSQPMNETE
jgi:predicted permease